MKKIILFIISLLVPSLCYAEVPSLAEALEWKYGACMGTKQANENDVSLYPKMVISYWNCGVPQPSDEVAQATISEYASSQDYFASKFDVKKMTHDLGLAFTGVEAVALAPYLGAYQSYSEAKNFKGIQDFTNGLVALGKATVEQAQKIDDIFADQGIILSEWN